MPQSPPPSLRPHPITSLIYRLSNPAPIPALGRACRCTQRTLITREDKMGEAGDTAGERASSCEPFYLQSLPVRLCKFSLICVACALAAGPVSSWPTVVPLLVKYRVFGNTTFRNVTQEEQQNIFDLVFNISSAFALLGSAVAGPIFDNLVSSPFFLFRFLQSPALTVTPVSCPSRPTTHDCLLGSKGVCHNRRDHCCRGTVRFGIFSL